MMQEAPILREGAAMRHFGGHTALFSAPGRRERQFTLQKAQNKLRRRNRAKRDYNDYI